MSRASASAASTSSRSRISPPEVVAITDSMTAGIRAKFNPPSRNADTATSLAALSDAGRKPPARAASCASASAGNRCRSGASNRRVPTLTRSRDCTPEATRSGHASACAMGVRMSGAPNCASTEPSTYSTSEWTMLSRWITTSTCCGVTPNSRQASMNSSPLFMSVAESTEILRPMTQLGCAQASSGVTRSRRARSVSRNGPPDAVSRMRFTPGGASPLRALGGRHWNTALCSLSMGSSVAPAARTHLHEQRARHHQRFLVG